MSRRLQEMISANMREECAHKQVTAASAAEERCALENIESVQAAGAPTDFSEVAPTLESGHVLLGRSSDKLLMSAPRTHVCLGRFLKVRSRLTLMPPRATPAQAVAAVRGRDLRNKRPVPELEHEDDDKKEEESDELDELALGDR